jgi:hypothetical protein
VTPTGCARCHRAAATAATWPDGRICRTCIGRASRTRGRCPRCGASRLLPGLAGGTAICRDCAGITRDFTCCRCSIEGLLTSGKICERCALAERLDTVLDDGSGRITSALLPLRQALLAMPKPSAGLAWLRNRPAADLLTAAATGTLELTHEALAAWPNRQTSSHLRDLLTATGILPGRDPHLADFESWLHHRLESLTGHPHLGMLRRYATFALLSRLRAAAPGTLITGSARYAIRAFTCGQAFCDWLQETGIRPASLTQAGLDRWHAAASRTTAKMTSGFLGFAMTEGSLPRLKLPAHPAACSSAQPISQQQRLALVRHALTGSTGPVRTRAASLLVLLFAQPASRITRLTLDDITTDGTGTTFLRLGDPPVSVPGPFAALLREAAAAASDHLAAAISPAGRWLFPGQNAGRPLHPATLSHLLTQYGIPVPAARTAAFRALVQQAPAPVIAQALGYSGTAATSNAAAAADTWSRYAAGDHTR